MVLSFCGEVEDIYDVIYPYYIASKVLGFAAFPLRIQKTKYLFFKHFILNSIYAIVVGSIIFGSMWYFRERQEEYFAYDQSQAANLTRSILIIMVAMNYFVGFVMNFFLQRPIQNLVVKFAQNDVIMERIGIRFNYAMHRKVVILFYMQTLVHGALMILYVEVAFLYSGIEKSIWEQISTYVSTTITFTTYLGQMLLTLLGIFFRFRLLNKYFVEKFMEDKKSTEIIFVASKSMDKAKDFYGRSMNDPAELIRKIATIHDSLNGIVCQMNFCFSFQIMMNMISWFIYTIYGTFNFYRLILINFKGYELLGYANMMWIVYHAMYLSAVVIFSSLIKAEGKKTSILLHQAINLEWNSKIVREMRIFSQQLGHRQPIVTCGLFPFDWSLFYSSIGLCVTYLTIMIQLDSSYSNPQLNVTLPAT
uniref:Gustatory receptor n=1 Tax=Lutzomyia longipalpis TaxID=7200 RepID=A0A3F2ZDH9_LUTLO